MWDDNRGRAGTAGGFSGNVQVAIDAGTTIGRRVNHVIERRRCGDDCVRVRRQFGNNQGMLFCAARVANGSYRGVRRCADGEGKPEIVIGVPFPESAGCVRGGSMVGLAPSPPSSAQSAASLPSYQMRCGPDGSK